MECVYFDLGGGRLMELLESPVLGRKYLVGKSGAWPKIFGWKVRCLAENIRLEIRKSLENIWFEIRKIWDISGIINFGDWDELVGLRPFAHLYLFATFYSIRIDYGVGVYDNSYSQCQVIPFLTDIL
jgi:hypothetical protein